MYVMFQEYFLLSLCAGNSILCKEFEFGKYEFRPSFPHVDKFVDNIKTASNDGFANGNAR